MRTGALVIALIGCGGAVQYGSFVQGSPRVQAAVAADAARRLAADYEPDGASIRFAHDGRDAFGRSFATALRKSGFAVKDATAERSAGELSLRYVFDQIKGTDLLRVSLYIERRTLSRAYAQRSGGVYPVGPWSVGGP